MDQVLAVSQSDDSPQSHCHSASTSATERVAARTMGLSGLAMASGNTAGKCPLSANCNWCCLGFATAPGCVQTWLYASPVVYSREIVPAHIRPFYFLNPMVGLIELSRFAVTGQGTVDLQGLGISAVAAIALFIFGSTVFRWVERDSCRH